MPPDLATEPDTDDADSDPEFVEVDPSGRYGRYKEVLGKGAFKKVYRAFDEWEGIEVAWNQVKVADLLRNSVDLERLYSEVHLLKTLKHKNIIKFYNSWVDTKNEHINFITEIFTSGTLRQYRKKHKHVDVRALKKWSRQILEGLSYLHSHDPPVIHRDLKCDNIFVNGNQGEVKIGDLGLAAILQQARAAHSVIGTPEFMAPELYEEEYNELVDIYAFGMCLLELVTLEYPYVECSNAAQIFKKVTAGIKPLSLGKVKDADVRTFIEKCIAKVSDRLSARELLMDPFLQSAEDYRRSHPLEDPQPSRADHNGVQDDDEKAAEDSVLEGSRDFTVQGQRKDNNTIFLKLRIEDLSGNVQNIHFPFDIEADTSTAVASEMVEELKLTDHDVTVIAAMIDSEIQSHIPDWAPKEDRSNISAVGGEEIPGSNLTIAQEDEDISLLANDEVQTGPHLVERLPSGRKYWKDSPIASSGTSPHRPGPCHHSVDSGDSWSEENSQSPSSHRDSSFSYSASPLRHVEFDYHQHANNRKKEVADSNQSEEAQSHTCSVGIESTVRKVELMLEEQMKEMETLKQKHKTAVVNMLKELEPETRQRVLEICSKRFLGDGAVDEGSHYLISGSMDVVD